MQVLLQDAPKPIKGLETLANGTRLVKRYRNGRCFAAVWSADTTDNQIRHDMSMAEANFFPYNETTGEFCWELSNRPSHFRI